MNRISEMRADVARAFGALNDENKILDLQRALETYIGELEYTAGLPDVDRENIAAARLDLAQMGLRLLQHTLPRLKSAAAAAIEAAGAPAVRAACTPIKVEPLGAGKWRESPSAFTLPEQYRTAAQKAGDAVRSRAGGVRSLLP